MTESERRERRPTKGQTLTNFELPDEGGDSFDLYERLESGPLVLVFYRGDW